MEHNSHFHGDSQIAQCGCQLDVGIILSKVVNLGILSIIMFPHVSQRGW